ncbi:unnamed protein product, partial [Strongylus vulgaris]
FCVKWQRSAGDVNKRSTEQDAFEDFALELFTGLDPVSQISAAVDLVQFILRLGSDYSSELMTNVVDQAIFDRSKYSLPKLRHFRFVAIGLVAKLSILDDAHLYQSMILTGKRLMAVSIELAEFVEKENLAAEQGNEPQTVRYWVALSSRAEAVADKLRHLMPGGVAARIIVDTLEDDSTDTRMREKALQLANLKLVHDGFFFTESGINEEHLEKMAIVLNKWLIKERLDMDKVADYQTLDDSMVGNVLLLAGELIRYEIFLLSHNMKTTMISAIPLLKTCLDIINECYLSQKKSLDSCNQQEDAASKRRRVRQHSLSGKRLGSSSILICALTCTQRVLDQFAPFVSQYIPEVLVQYCRLYGR